MARINHKWKKFMAVGCSHGYWADPTALEAVLKFKKAWKPDMAIHLGDYMDETPWRAGAGDVDNLHNLNLDIEMGLDFLTRFEPNLLFNGNHDIRVWEALDKGDAIRRAKAEDVIQSIHRILPKHTEFVESYNIMSPSVRTIGDTQFLHGVMYSENAVRDHAAHFGKCVFAHLHKVAIAPANRLDSPSGYCVGYLGDINKFSYAVRRRAISQWSQGFAWGEYSDKECIVYLNERNREGEWHLPNV
jgi:hypothetical protein